MSLRVYLPSSLGERFEAVLRSTVAGDVTLVVGGDGEPPGDYDVLVAGRPTEDDLDRSPSLRTLVIPWAGLPPATRDLLRRRTHIAVHNLHHNAPATAEMAVGLLLAAARRIVPADRALRQGDWRPRYDAEQGMRLVGRRALVLGYGAIGQRVARALVALGMTVDAVRRRRVGSEEGVAIHGLARIDALLPTADVLVVCVPSTERTAGLLDAQRLALLPRGAVLVNVARGDVVDEDALYEALSSERLGGAGLDVWWRYPPAVEARASTLPSARPFHALENVVLSPHRAGHGQGTERERARHLADTLNALARGEVPAHRVDVDEGY